MNFLHHRQKTRCQVLPMPDGLQELMSDISREVLRCQPTIDCIYKFVADYLDAQIIVRDKSKIAMEIIDEAILKTDEIYDQFVKCNIPKDKTNSFLDLMEITFRRFVDQKRRLKEDPRYITFHADDMLEELIRKCDLTKVEILRSRPAIQWAYKKFVKTYLESIGGYLDTEDLYLETDKLVATCNEFQSLHEAAVLIQKVFRGYRTRKSLERSSKAIGLTSSKTSFELFIMNHDEDITEAAIKIQALYKGFITRKKLEMSASKTTDQLSEMEWIQKFVEENSEEINKAAIKIQARYKGFTVRKKMPIVLKLEAPTQDVEEEVAPEPIVEEVVAEAPPAVEAPVEEPTPVEAPVEEPPQAAEPAVEAPAEEPPAEEPPAEPPAE